MDQPLQPKLLLAIMRDQSSPPEITTSYADLHTAITAAIREVEERERNQASPPRIAIHAALSTRQTLVEFDHDTCTRLCALAWEGQILVSGAAKATLQTVSAKEERLRSLGQHRLSNLSRSIELYQVVHPALLDDFPPLRSLNHFPHNLPILETPFIGRETEQAEVWRLLSGTSLVTLVGTGGSGKTRLALQVAANQIADYSDGVWVVDLALRTKADDVPIAIAEALQVVGEPGRSVDDLLRAYLQGKRTLLVLDNCEHLRDGCAAIIDRLLATCPGLTVLGTSRERLELDSERLLPLQPLSIPPESTAPLEQIRRYESVQLFLERAQRVRDFQVTAEHAEPLVSICTRLDGIPLALELAAGQARYQSISEIARQLERILDLPSGNRAAHARHRTLRATLDWSYSLLPPPAQALWRYLSVTAGNFSLEMIQYIWSAMGVWGECVEDMLAELVDESLVGIKENDGQTRYHMLQLLRKYGRAKLRDAGEEGQVNAHLLDWALHYTQNVEAALQGPDFVATTKYVEREYENLKAALRWAEEAGAVVAGLKLAVNLFLYWYYHQYFQSSRQEQNWLAVFLSRYDGSDMQLRAKALFAEGLMAERQGDHVCAVARLQESSALWKAQSEDSRLGDSLIVLGNCWAKEKNWARAEQTYAQADLVLRRSGDRLGRARYLWNVGDLRFDQGEHDLAAHAWAESLALMRDLGYNTGMAVLLHNLGLNAKARGEYETALQHLENSLQWERELGRGWRVVDVLLELVGLHMEMERYERAAGCAAECLSFTERLGDPSQIARTVIAIAKLLGYRHLDEGAISLLLGIAGYIAEATVMPEVKEEYNRLLTGLRNRSDERTLAGLYPAKRPTLHALVVQAQAALRLVLEETQAKPQPQPQAANNWGLTERELDVVRAVVDELGRKEIGERLFISEKTVDNHLTNITDKLGLEGRRMTALLTWALQHGFKRTESRAGR